MTQALDTLVRRAVDAAGLKCREHRTIELVRHEPTADGRVLLVFLDGETEPAIFLKLGSGTRIPALETEFKNLGLLKRLGSAELRERVAHPLLLDWHDGFRVLATRAYGSMRMKDYPPAKYFASARFDRQLHALLDWWHEFRVCFEKENLGATPDAAAEIAAYREHYRRSRALDELLDESAAALAGLRLPPCPLHGDLCTANVLVGEADRFWVIDWESRIGRGWPLADVLYFYSSIWVIEYGKGATVREANFRSLFFEPTAHNRKRVELIDRLMRQLKLPPSATLPLSVLSWVSHANRKRAALGMEGPIPDGLAARHFPLVVVRDGHCRNLELLASLRADYLPGSADGNRA